MTRRHFGRYEVQAEVGDGAMGRVYRCVDPLMLRVVAVKTVKTEYLTRDTRDEYLRRFRREAQAAGRIAHPHIVGIYDVGEDFFVMEFLEGDTLQTVLRQRGRLPLDEALALLTPLADALDYAHHAGIVHRDIKPGNVMVLPDGRPKLMDFGVAHLESSVMTAAGHFFGSPSYMSPEQVSGGELSAAADLFSFAVVAYEAITGHRPFEGDSVTAVMYRVVNNEAPPPRHWVTDLPPIFDDIFRRALEKDPGQRFRDATSLVRALEQRDLAGVLQPAPSNGGPGPTPAPASDEPASIATAETHDLGTATPVPPAASTRPSHMRGRRLGLAVLAALALVAALVAARVRLPASSSATAPLAAPASPLPFRIETDPPGADVWLDGAPAGAAPVMLEGVVPGVHDVRVAAAGYAPARLSLQLRAGEPPPPLRFVMEPMTARLVARTEPAGALVRVDGQPVGMTPLEGVPLEAGRHDVRIEKPGFGVVNQQVEGRPGEAVELRQRLAPLPRVVKSPSAFGPGWIEEGMLVPLDATVTPPRRISGEPAPYPAAARRLHLVGAVVVDILVDEKGAVQDPHVIQSAGEVLDRAVLAAVRDWRYEPARKNGVRVKVRVQARHTFMEGR